MAHAGPLITGVGGQLGSAFTRLIEEAVEVPRDRLDLAKSTSDDVRRLLETTVPSMVINCAAYTAVDRAESEEELATEVNGHAVGRLAQATAEAGLPFVTFSTDYVFDGSGRRPYLEGHPTDPINAYGRSKLVGEQAVLLVNPAAMIVRTSWLLSATHRNFVTAILARASEGQPLRVVDDQIGCPTVVDDLAKATLEAMGQGATGLLHLTNRGETTWYELARTAVERAGFDVSLVSPCPSVEYPTPARRPAYSVLGSEVAADLGLTPLPEWRQSLDDVVNGSLGLIAG